MRIVHILLVWKQNPVFVFKDWLLSSLWVTESKVTPIRCKGEGRGQGMFYGCGHRRAQQARVTPGSFIQRKRSQSEEAALQQPRSRLRSGVSSIHVGRLCKSSNDSTVSLPTMVAVSDDFKERKHSNIIDSKEGSGWLSGIWKAQTSRKVSHFQYTSKTLSSINSIIMWFIL